MGLPSLVSINMPININWSHILSTSIFLLKDINLIFKIISRLEQHDILRGLASVLTNHRSLTTYSSGKQDLLDARQR